MIGVATGKEKQRTAMIENNWLSGASVAGSGTFPDRSRKGKIYAVN